MTKTNIEKLYTLKSDLYHFIFYDLLRYNKSVNSFLKKSQYIQSNFKVLDAGCGAGLLTKFLWSQSQKKKFKNKFYAFDLTQNMLDLFRSWIKKKKTKNINLRKANVLNLNKLPTGWKSFDLIVSSAMLEYIPKRKLPFVLKNFKTLMKKDSKLLIFITKQNLITLPLVGYWWSANTYKKQELISICKSASFKKENIKFKKFKFPYDYMNAGIFILELTKS